MCSSILIALGEPLECPWSEEVPPLLKEVDNITGNGLNSFTEFLKIL